MLIPLFIAAALLVLGGLTGFYYALDLMPTDRGMAALSTGTMAFCAGIIVFSIAWAVRSLLHALVIEVVDEGESLDQTAEIPPEPSLTDESYLEPKRPHIELNPPSVNAPHIAPATATPSHTTSSFDTPARIEAPQLSAERPAIAVNPAAAAPPAPSTGSRFGFGKIMGAGAAAAGAAAMFGNRFGKNNAEAAPVEAASEVASAAEDHLADAAQTISNTASELVADTHEAASHHAEDLEQAFAKELESLPAVDATLHDHHHDVDAFDTQENEVEATDAPEEAAHEIMHTEHAHQEHHEDAHMPPQEVEAEEAPAFDNDVVGITEAGGVRYTMYVDGSVDVESPEGKHHFKSLDDLRAFIDKQDEEGEAV